MLTHLSQKLLNYISSGYYLRFRGDINFKDMCDSKVVLITGSSSGIGAATARLFSKRGFKVAVTGSNEERVEKVVSECNELSPHSFKVSFLRKLSHDDHY